MQQHLTRSRRPAHEFSSELVAAARFGPLLLALLLAGCGADSRQSPSPPSRDSDLPAALEAYQAYCSLCPRSGSCCLKGSDFQSYTWSKVSGRYLRAMRDHFDCMRGDMLIDQALYSEDRLGPEIEPAPPALGNTLSCESYACMGSATIMAAELDLALAAPKRHKKGAVLACAGED